MSEAGFQRCLAVAWLPQNDGQPLHTTRGDPGGATNWGVTFELFVAWRIHHRRPRPAIADFAAATKTELESIIRAWVWCAVQADRLPVGVDLMMFEMAFLSGAGTAGRILQTVLGVRVDGSIGDITLAAAQAIPSASLIEHLTTAYLAHVNGLDDASRFAHGWDRRIEDDEATAQSWITQAA